MSKVKDIILSGDDIDIINGDIAVDESDSQHIEHILRAAPGHYKETPLLGANIISLQHGNFDGNYRRQVRIQLEGDGYQIDTVKMNNGQIQIYAERK